MEYSYKTYQTKRGALTFDEMQDIHSRILEGLADDPTAAGLYGDMVRAGVTYINIRANWHLWSREERDEKGDFRTLCHDNCIITINVLARYMNEQGKDISWREALGDEAENRKRLGDFACYLAFVNALNAR